MKSPSRLTRPDRRYAYWDGREGPAVPIARDATRALVSSVLERHDATPAILRPGARQWRWMALTAATLLVAAGALAALYGNRVSPPASLPTSGVTFEERPAASEELTPPPRAEIAEETPMPHPASVPPASLPLAAPKRIDPPHHALAPSHAPPPPMDPRLAIAEPSRPDDLLQLANTLRGEHRWAEATRLYERVIAIAPDGPKAYVARVVAASLHLEHLGDPRGALALYNAALRQESRGALSEEILWSKAECHRALGERASEVEALRTFLDRYPRGLASPRAEARLVELGAR